MQGTTTLGEARFSPDGRHRYHLTRPGVCPGTKMGYVVFVMLNPSTADAERNDPTVTRVMGYARRWGYADAEVCNIFSIRSTDPAGIREVGSEGDPQNLETILWRAGGAEKVVCAWGTHGAWRGRGRIVLGALLRAGVEPWCLGVTKDGHPKHPLYLRGDATLVRVPELGGGF